MIYDKMDFFNNSIIIIIPLLLLLILNPFHKTMALSPSFELQELINENRHWVQTYGNNDAHLKSNYTDILSVDYISNGKTLNATFWLASAFKNSSAAIYYQPFRKISYGMLIDSDSNPKTGYNGADYDFYVESVAGKLSAYLYQLSSTGGYRLVGSKINYSQPYVDPNVLLGSVNLQLDLGSINYPRHYNVMFYTAEAFKSNEVRQFTSWVNIPPPSLQITTSPSNILIKQGEAQTIPARIKSTSGFSNDVINMTVGTNNNMGSGFNSSELHVTIQRIQPPLFKIAIPQQTPLGIYTIPLIVTIREPSEATLTKPISINARGGIVDPEFELSKKYPTVGYLTRPLNLTVTVISPSAISEQFRDFWGVYGGFIGIFAGGFVGAFAKLMFDRRKKRNENE
ncbi:MAG TPA: hypothetical protein VEL70_05130 [Candidatus Acidoferrum sp.]|jgi:hypothetical protein|nr:hypothetical protein [Candidatus Acidoferrum sp.]